MIPIDPALKKPCNQPLPTCRLVDASITEFNPDPSRVYLTGYSAGGNMVKALKSIGANVQYTEFPGVDHNAWDPAYQRVDMIQWMVKQSRKQGR